MDPNCSPVVRPGEGHHLVMAPLGDSHCEGLYVACEDTVCSFSWSLPCAQHLWGHLGKSLSSSSSLQTCPLAGLWLGLDDCLLLSLGRVSKSPEAPHLIAQVMLGVLETHLL